MGLDEGVAGTVTDVVVVIKVHHAGAGNGQLIYPQSMTTQVACNADKEQNILVYSAWRVKVFYETLSVTTRSDRKRWSRQSDKQSKQHKRLCAC